MGRKLRQINRWLRRRSKPKYKPKYKSPAKSEGIQFPRKLVAFVMLILCIGVFAHGFYRFDRQIIPLALEAAELRLQAEINNVINSVIQDIIRYNNITAQDFIFQSQPTPEQMPVLSVNTVLANEICNLAAKRISYLLNNLEPERIYVPLGMIFGLDIFSQIGPRFSFDLAPIGNALVNYETSFTAVGINQVHFSVWLNVDSIVRIINPGQSMEIMVARNVSLVDTVISGTVPGTYLNMDTPVLNLN